MTAKTSRSMTPLLVGTFEWTRDHILQKGCAPTLVEIAGQFGISKETAYERVMSLVGNGYLTKVTNGRRGIRLVEDAGKDNAILLQGILLGLVRVLGTPPGFSGRSEKLTDVSVCGQTWSCPLGRDGIVPRLPGEARRQLEMALSSVRGLSRAVDRRNQGERADLGSPRDRLPPAVSREAVPSVTAARPTLSTDDAVTRRRGDAEKQPAAAANSGG